MSGATISVATSSASLGPASQGSKTADWQRLHAEARSRVEQAVQSFGNIVSPDHRRALSDLTEAMARQAHGVDVGRFAYAAPCGAGKTQSVVALIAAAYSLRQQLTFAVAANTIRALCLIKRDLIAAGVPEHMIGLRHGKSDAEMTDELLGEQVSAAATRDTGSEDRPIMLVSHSRIRGASGSQFATYSGEPRNLLIWDETLLTSSAGALPLKDLRAAAGYLASDARYGSALREYVDQTLARLVAEIARQGQGEAPGTLTLSDLGDPHPLRSALRPLQGGRPMQRAAASTIERLLRLSEMPIAVAITASGGDSEALIYYRIVVDPAWQNVSVLDASHSVRILAQLSGIQDRTTPAMRNCKRYDNVTVIQHAMPAGRSTLELGGAAMKLAFSAVAKILHALPPDQSALIFTFKAMRDELVRFLRGEGIDLNEAVNGRPRFPVETWGRETSSNAYSHCAHVLLVGVMRRSYSDLAANFSGESDDLKRRATEAQLRAVMDSEMASCVLQAMHRGACRTVDGSGQAGGMTVYLLDRQVRLKELLADSLPGVNWQVVPPRRPGSALGRGIAAINQVLEQLPASQPSISAIELLRLVRAKGVALSESGWRKAIKSALQQSNIALLLADRTKGRWQQQNGGRSLVRTGASAGP